MQLYNLVLAIATLTYLFHPLNMKAAASPERHRKMYLCGQHLATLLSELCHGRYNGPREERSGSKIIVYMIGIYVVLQSGYRYSESH